MRQKMVYILLILMTGCVKSNPVPTTPTTPVLTIPNAPTDVKGILSAPTQIDLTWTDASNNEDGFKVERKSGADAFSLIATLGQNVVTYSDKGFTSGPTFSYRVYSYNTKGNSNNTNEVSIVTLGVPTLSTKSIADTTAINALTGGTVTSDGGGQVTARGVVWSTSTNPTIALSTKTVDSLGVGGYNSFITGLTANTKYYVRAYATNAAGTGYGNEISFTTNTINIPNGLVAYYLFMGNSKDSSVNKNDQIEYLNPTYVEDRNSIKNSAIYFNGASYTLSNNIFMKSSNDYAISIWFNSNTLQPATLINTNPHTILDVNLNYVKPNKLAYFIGDGKSGTWSVAVDQIIDYSITNQKWYNLIINFSSNLTNVTKPNTWDFYIDGKLLNTYTSNKLPSTDFTKLGFGTAFVFGNIQYFIGAIDDVRIYNRALTSAEITYLYNH